MSIFDKIKKYMRKKVNVVENVEMNYDKIDGIEFNSTEMNVFVSNKVRMFLQSENRQKMLIGEQYYLNNSDIQNKEVTNNGPSGNANTKNENAFVKTLVDQKCDYLFANQPTLKTFDKDYLHLINQYLDAKFSTLIHDICEESINKGVAYVQPYFQNNELKFRLHKSEEIIPIWNDSSHTSMDAFIRVYAVYSSPYKASTKVEMWTKDTVTYFDMLGTTLTYMSTEQMFNYPEEDINDENVKKGNGDISYEHGDVENSTPKNKIAYDRIPLIAFKNNRNETPFINVIKSLVDSYNMIDSMSSDVLIDIPLFVYIVKNYGGSDPSKIMQLLREHQLIQVEENGDVTKLQPDIKITEINEKLSALQSNIFNFGRGVDTQDDKFGAKSGVSIEFKMNDLDLDCKRIENYFKTAFDELLYFVDMDIKNKYGVDYSDEKVEFCANKDTVTSTNDKIDGLVKLKGIISKRTLLSEIPYVDDVDAEMGLLLEEETASMINIQAKNR